MAPDAGRPSDGWVGALRERNFRRFYIGNTTSVLGSAMRPVALTFAVLNEGRSAADVGYVLTAQVLPLVALLLAGGVLADRLPRRALMLSADAGRCVVEVVLAWLLIRGTPPLWSLMLLSGLMGVGQAFFSPAMTGLVPSIVTPGHLQQANALNSLSSSVGQIVGPAIAGVIVATAGPGWAVLGDGVSFAVSVTALSRLDIPPLPPRGRESFFIQLREGWQEFASRTWLWVIVVQFALFHLVSYAPFVVVGATEVKELLGGAGAWGAILAGQGVGSLIGGALSLRLRPRRPLVVATIGTLGFAAPVALLAARVPIPWIVAAAVVSGAGVAVFGAVWETALQQHVPPDKLSRVSAYDWLGSIGLMPIGYAIAGPVAAAIGNTTTLAAAAVSVVVLGGGVLLVPAVRLLEGGAPAELASTSAG